MPNDKRNRENPIPDNLQTLLTPAQSRALEYLELLGWHLKFVRRPLFQQPVPVVCSRKSGQIGVLDPDGRIDVDFESGVRSEDEETELKHSGRTDKLHLRTGESPVPDNLDELLNDRQLMSLHQIEQFGWQIHFVRRANIDEPTVVIMNANGDHFATLEADGSIEISEHCSMRQKLPKDTAANSSD